MHCLHPNCPMGQGAKIWNDVVESPLLKARPADKPVLLAALNAHFGNLASPPVTRVMPVPNAALVDRLLRLCPCLFNQIDVEASSAAVIHFCEITLGKLIKSANVHDAFKIQHPSAPMFKYPPAKPCNDGGAVMEMLCSEVLTNEGIPPMQLDAGRWPVWAMPGHIIVNSGKMREVKALGDILIPCAPTNLLISVKSEVARERLLYSANSIEGIGFGFFKEPQEFWSRSRMLLFKRMGFTAIYMPDDTQATIAAKLKAEANERLAVNLNGTDLYRPLSLFGADMLRVVGKTSFAL
jgi:hypothetical protein